MRTTIYNDVLECAASWPGSRVAELVEAEELRFCVDYCNRVVGELRAEGLLLRASPALLRVSNDWQVIVTGMHRRYQMAAAAIAAGADSYDKLGEVLGKAQSSAYAAGHRLIEAGAVLDPRGIYLAPAGERLLKDRQRRIERQKRYRAR